MRRLLFVAAGLALAVTTFLTHAQVHHTRVAFPRDQDVLYVPPAGYVEAASLGYREAFADLVWIRAVIFAGERGGSRNFTWIARYLDAITTLAPRFRRPYAWGGVTAIYSGNVIDRTMVDSAIAMYRRGLAQFPEDHELLFSCGMLLYREVQGIPGYTDEEKAEAEAEGAEMIRKAASFGAPPLVRQLAATIVSEGSTDQLAIQFLEEQMLQVEDEDYRRLLERKLEKLVGETGVASVARTRAVFEAERQALFPYLPPDVYAILQPATSGAK